MSPRWEEQVRVRARHEANQPALSAEAMSYLRGFPEDLEWRTLTPRTAAAWLDDEHRYRLFYDTRDWASHFTAIDTQGRKTRFRKRDKPVKIKTCLDLARLMGIDLS